MAEKQKLIMCRGIPSSGKSTWAKEQVVEAQGKLIRVNRDDMRAMLYGKTKLSRDREQRVLAMHDDMVRQTLASKLSVVLDNTNMKESDEQKYRDIAKHYGAEFVLKEFHIDVDEAILRDAGRPNPVGPKVIRRFYNAYIEPKLPKQVIDPKLPYCIICDLDGTLADFKTKGHRGPFDGWDKCHEDDVVEHIEEIITTFRYEKGDTIIFLSGREEKARASTIEFFKNQCHSEHEWWRCKLFMRKDGDDRKDTIVKKELYQEHIIGRYNVRFVLDDRTSVVKMWRRELGLVCLQVAEGDF